MIDPYVYPGTTVLINLRNISDKDGAEKFERMMSRQRLSEPPPCIRMDYAGYKRLHHHLFQDVYGWAGQSRTVNIAKDDLFCLAPYVDSQMEARFLLVQKENGLKGLDQDGFLERAAEHICEINAVHPFREGNGRTLRLFLKVLAAQAGHRLSIDRIKPKEWLDASIRGFRGDYALMRAVIRDLVGEIKPLQCNEMLADPTREYDSKHVGWKSLEK